MHEFASLFIFLEMPLNSFLLLTSISFKDSKFKDSKFLEFYFEILSLL